MNHDARVVANYLIQRSLDDNKPLTNMQVLKLAYFAHAWSLALLKDPLVKQDVVAWTHGPVIVDVYEPLKGYGSQEITKLIDVTPEEFSEEEKDIMNQVYDQYGPLHAFNLSALTHVPGTPWFRVWNDKGMGAKIPERMIQRHYEEVAKQHFG